MLLLKLACVGARKCPHTVPLEKLQLDAILSLHVKSLSWHEKSMLFVDYPWNRKMLTWIVRRAFNEILTEIKLKLNPLTGNHTNSSDREGSGRGLQKEGQRAFPSVLGGLWWLDPKREQHGRQFAGYLINISQIFNILGTLAAREL